jgi:hypothetical protein
MKELYIRLNVNAVSSNEKRLKTASTDTITPSKSGLIDLT